MSEKALPVARRSVLAGLGATAIAPAGWGQTDRFAGILDRAKGLDQLQTLQVSRKGSLLVSEAFRGRGLSRAANIKSVSKTMVATVAGIAIGKGLIEGPDVAAVPLMGRAPAGAQADITLGHLLSMRSGLESTSGPNYGEWVSSRNWVDYALAREQLAPPGARFIYSTGSFHLAGVALSEAAGMSLWEMTQRWLGEPLGVEFPMWVRDPQGYFLGGNEMAMSPEALLSFGEMILAGGRLGEAQVVPEDWLEVSTVPRGRSPWSGDMYGYGWFLTLVGGQRAMYGRGYGGQLIMLVPSLELAMVITSDPGRPARSGGYFGDLRRLTADIVAEVLKDDDLAARGVPPQL